MFNIKTDHFIKTIKPVSVEVYDAYRNGNVATVTFEKDQVHFCYGVDFKTGQLFDLCYIGDTIFHNEDTPTDEDLVKVQELIDSEGYFN